MRNITKHEVDSYSCPIFRLKHQEIHAFLPHLIVDSQQKVMLPLSLAMPPAAQHPNILVLMLRMENLLSFASILP
jgi:hypothetical protein